jgi:hypothetical protein
LGELVDENECAVQLSKGGSSRPSDKMEEDTKFCPKCQQVVEKAGHRCMSGDGKMELEGERRKCTGCGKTNHTEKSCFVLHPQLRNKGRGNGNGNGR